MTPSILEAVRDDLLTVKEFADAVRMNPVYIRAKCREGTQIGAIRIGGQWRIYRSLALPSTFSPTDK